MIRTIILQKLKVLDFTKFHRNRKFSINHLHLVMIPMIITLKCLTPTMLPQFLCGPKLTIVVYHIHNDIILVDILTPFLWVHHDVIEVVN